MTVRPAMLGVLLAFACRSPSGLSAVAQAHAGERQAAADGGPDAPGSIAVVELFTSEGCSSCPPADALLTELGGDAPSVYALAFHVDYWDSLGWADPFASPAWTARQRLYAASFGTSDLYTPEMIVGGTESFTGSDRKRASAAIARTLASAPAVGVTVRARAASLQDVEVDVEAPGTPLDARLQIALVQGYAVVDVRAGENGGRTLRHTHVVRAWETAQGPRATVTFPIPAGMPRAQAEIVALVQRDAGSGAGMPFLGAGRTPLP